MAFVIALQWQASTDADSSTYKDERAVGSFQYTKFTLYQTMEASTNLVAKMSYDNLKYPFSMSVQL